MTPTSQARLNQWHLIYASFVSPKELACIEPASLLEEILARGRRVG